MKQKYEVPVVVALLLLSTLIAWALSPSGAVNSSGVIVPIRCDANGNLQVTGGYSRVQSSTSAKSDSIATNAATLISSIASITPPCSVQISCPAGQLWYAPGLATTTLASMKYHVLDEFQSVVFNVSTSTWDCSVAGVSAVSSCSVTVHSLVQ